MKVAVIQFPGSNCDQDALYALREDVGVQAEYVWHDNTSLAGFDAVFVPGGFSYGDYLRCGAMAARSRVMDAVRDLAKAGHPVIGVCNGFQILCEAGLLPGALLQNRDQKFICQDVFLRMAGASIWTGSVSKILRIPIAHGEGRYVADDDTLLEITERGQVAFRYVNATGEDLESANVNGSMESIAGVTNRAGNVLGMMPHPERATKAMLGSSDGLTILKALTLVRA